nr:homeobox protein ARX-like [Pocillopora verrucosa]
MFYNLKGIFDNWLCQGHERDEKLQKVLDQLNPSCKEETNKRITPKSEKTRPPKRTKRCTGGDSEKRYRATFDKSQIYQMERVFLLNHYPDVAARSELSNSTGLSEAQVQIWFQNRRAKWRKQQRKRRHDVPTIFGLGYPSHLARFCGGFEPYTLFPYEYYNTDFWTCARQQVAAFQFASMPSSPTPPASSSPHDSCSPKSTDSAASSSEEAQGEVENLEIRNDSSLLSLRLRAKEHIAAMEQESQGV